MGATEEMLAAVSAGAPERLPPAWARAVRFAEALAPQRGRAPASLLAELREMWSDEQLVEITAVIALFSYFNRFAEGLEIPLTR